MTKIHSERNPTIRLFQFDPLLLYALAMIIRHATDADRPRIAALHVASWQVAYRGVFPDRFLDEDLPQELAAYWATPRPGNAFRLIAEADDGTALGFAGVTEHEGPYIEALHVAPQAKGRGIGRQLMTAVADALWQRGETWMHLTVVTTNTAALGFYRRQGGAVSEPFADDLFGHALTSVDVRWPDLATLL